MDNDTPTNPVEESHDPFILERNDAADQSVLTGMDDTHITPTADTDEIAVSTAIDSDPLAAESTSLPEASPTPGPEFFAPTTQEFPAADPATEVPFVYDDVTIERPSDRLAEPQPPAPQPKRGDGGLYVIGAVVAAILGSLLTIGILAMTGTFDDAPAVIESAPPATIIETSQPQIINGVGSGVNPTAIAQKVIPSIVTVNVFEDGTNGDGEATQFASGSGSGVVMSTEGYIITNHHVIDEADSVSVTFEDGRRYEASLVGSDELTDLAVLKIDALGLVPVEFGTTDGLAIGDPAVAIGNPLGQSGGSSISAGIVSAFDRRVDFADSTSLFGMIQTDAAINSGSSGGALVDADGKLVGITAAIGVSTAGPEGIGYAIPIEVVDRITKEIIETGDVQHPFMGVEMQTFFDEQSDGAIVPAGAIVGAITGEDSAAGKAGIEAGDIVIAIEGDAIATQSDLALAVRLYRVGDTITFTVDRAGEIFDIEVTLGQRPVEFQG